MRLVLDTNVVVSGLLWNGIPSALLDAARIGEIELFTSTRLLAELAGILTRAKFAKALAAIGLPREALVLGYAELAAIVQPAPIPLAIAVDPSDDQVLACALAASADLIVSGDKHLLALGGQYQGIPIVTPTQAVPIIDR